MAIDDLSVGELNLLQFRSLGRVFNGPAFGFQFVSDFIGALEILSFFGSRGLRLTRKFPLEFPLPISCRSQELNPSGPSHQGGLAAVALKEFSPMRRFNSRTHSNTVPHAAETFRSSSNASVNVVNKLRGNFRPAFLPKPAFRALSRSLPRHSSMRASAVFAPPKPSSVKLNVSR